MCTYRFPDPDFERSFYRELFGVEPLHEEPERDLDSAVTGEIEISRTGVVQPDREVVTVG
jgi:hypothetical protein